MVAVATEQPVWQQLLRALCNKSATNQQRLGIYQKLSSELCEVPSDCSLDNIRDDFTSTVAVICGDILCQDEELVLCALYAMGLFLHHQHLVSLLPSEEAAGILRALCGTVMETANKNVCTRALWCLAKQNLPVDAVKAELHRILSTIEHGQCRKNLQSMTVEHEALNAIIRLLEVVPDPMADHTGVWAKLVYPLLVHGAHKVRERAMVAMEMGLSAMMQHQMEFNKNLEDDLKTLLIGELHKLMSTGEEVYALKVWGMYIKLLGKTLHKSPLINPLLRVPQQGFRHSSATVKCATFGAWKTLIDNFALNPDILADHSRVKLIMQVFARLNAKEESVALAKLEAWWHFLQKLGTKLPSYFEQVCVPLLQFCTNGVINSVGFTPAKSAARTPTHNKLADRAGFGSPGTPQMNLTANPGSSVPTFPVIQRKGCEVIAQFLGTRDEDGDRPIRFTLEPLKQTVIAGVPFFVKHAPALIGAVRESIVLQGDKILDGLLYCVWYSLVAHVKNVLETAGKKDSVDVFVCFLENLHQIVHSDTLAADRVLKLLGAVLCLPSRALVSAAYSTGGTTEVMQNCPALVLMDLLLHQSLVDSSSTHQRFFSLHEKLVSCGFGNGCSALDFSQVALQLIDRAATYTQNKDALWQMWGTIVNPVSEHIAKTSEVNQGDLLEHNFSCLYAVLLFPVQHLIPYRMVQSMQKTLLKIWTELCNAFARLAAMVTNAEANVWVEELCAKIYDILPTISRQGAQCVDGLLQVCLVVISNIDFSAPVSHGLLNSKCHHFGPIPTSFGRWKQKPLGNLHSVVRLVAQLLGMLCDLIERPQAESETKKVPNSAFQSPALSAVQALNSLFSNVTVSTVIAEMITRLCPGLAGLYAIAAKRSNQKVFSAPVLEKFDSLWATFASMMKTRYTGIYDSELLVQMTPLFEVGFKHPRKVIKNQTISLWNTTFGQGAPLKYPDSLKPVIARVLSSVTLLLPGWDSADVVDDCEATFSEATQGESQCIVPNIVGFPSPLKGCGSFMHKVASPNVKKSPLPASPSPCRQKAATARRKLPLALDDLQKEDFVVIRVSPRKKQALTEHQKEVKRERRVLPVMYNNLDASQDTQLESLDTDTQMTNFDGESSPPLVTASEIMAPPLQSVRSGTQVVRNTGGEEKEIEEETADKPKDRRKRIRWALDKNSNIPVDHEPKDELGNLQSGAAVNKTKSEPDNSERTESLRSVVAMETDLDKVSHGNSKTPLGFVKAMTSEEIKAGGQTKSTSDSRGTQPLSEKTKQSEVRTLVRRTRSFTRASSAISPVKIRSPRKQSPSKQSPRKVSPSKRSLSPTKATIRRQSSRSPMKTTCHLQEKLDHWLTKSCDNTSSKTTSDQNVPLSTQVDCTVKMEDVSSELKDARDKGMSEKDVSMGNIGDQTNTSSFDRNGDVDPNGNECSQTVMSVGPALILSRVPVVELHKLSEDEIQSFSPKKKNKRIELSEIVVTRESKIVDRSRGSDESDSDHSTASDDLFAPFQNSVGCDTNYALRNVSKLAMTCSEESREISIKSLSEMNVEKVNTDDSLASEIKVTKQNESYSTDKIDDVSLSQTDHLTISDDRLCSNATGADMPNAAKNLAASSDLGSRSRPRRPPGWLRDMECEPLSPRSREKTKSSPLAKASPLAKKTASMKTLDFTPGGRSVRHKKASLNFDIESCIGAVNGGVAPVNGEVAQINGGVAPVNGGVAQINGGVASSMSALEMGKVKCEEETITDRVACDGESEPVGGDEITTVNVRWTRNSSKSSIKVHEQKPKSTVIVSEKPAGNSVDRRQNANETDSIVDGTSEEMDGETTTGSKSAADTNEDTPQSAPSSVSCGKRNSSKQAKKLGASSGKRGKIKAKVLDTFFSKQCNLDVEMSDEENVPLSVLSETPEGAEGIEDLPLSQLAQTFQKEECLSDVKDTGSNCEMLSQDSMSSIADMVSEDLGPTLTETASSDTAESYLTMVKDLETAMLSDGASKNVEQPPSRRGKKQSAIQKLDNQLGIDMTSPVRKCLRSNKCAKLFKPRRNILSLDSIRRRRQRNVSRKRKRESGNHHSRSSSEETECEAIAYHQESEPPSACVPQDGSTIQESTILVEMERNLETVDTEGMAAKEFDKQEIKGDDTEAMGTPTKLKQSVDSKDVDIDKKASFAMSRASLILHRARLIMRSNKPSPGNGESVAMAMDSDNAKPQLPRCVGILKPPRQGEGNVERDGQSPPSKFRPVQLPCVYSPSASPSAGILKKQRLSSDVPNESPSPKSPSKKRRRVSFAESVQTVEFRRHATRARPVRRDSPRGVNRCLEIPRRKRSPLSTVRLWGSRHKPTANSVVPSDTSNPITEEPLLNSTDPIFPNLVDCDTRVEQVLPQLTSSFWVRGLEQLVHAKNLRTIGDLSGLTEAEVNNLPIRSPKVITMKRALQSFSESKMTHSTKSTGVILAERESEKDSELVQCGLGSPSSPEKQQILITEKEEMAPLVLAAAASPDKPDSGNIMAVTLSDPDRLSPDKELEATSPTKGELPCVEDELAKLSPIKKGDLDSSLEYSLLMTETSGEVMDEPKGPSQREPQAEHDTDMEIFSSKDTILDSTNDAEVIAMDISGLKERLASTDLTQLGSHDLVKVHEQLNSMMASVVLALKAKCCTSPKRAGNSQ